jgi:hypothetical protein
MLTLTNYVLGTRNHASTLIPVRKFLRDDSWLKKITRKITDFCFLFAYKVRLLVLVSLQ